MPTQAHDRYRRNCRRPLRLMSCRESRSPLAAREGATRRVAGSPRCPASAHAVAATIRPMHGLMMDYPLTLSTIFRRAETLFRTREIVWRNADASVSRYTCADFAGRARRLAQVLL